MAHAYAEKNRPCLIKVKSIIGFGSPNKQNTSGVHGSPLGEDELKQTKKDLGWEYEGSFVIPEKAGNVYRQCIAKGDRLEQEWLKQLVRYENTNRKLFDEFHDAAGKALPKNWEQSLPQFEAGSKLATRVASGKTLEAMMPLFPLFMGGSADLTPSNNTKIPDTTSFRKTSPTGRYLHFGVREHAMGAILNGISLSGLVRAYGATFLCFSDYMLPAIRVAALSGYGSIFVFTHDSIGLGEDGPTHQPVEQLAYLRALPGLVLFRPADANETVQAWKYMLQHHDFPTAIALTRQGVPTLDRNRYGSADQVDKGAYTLVAEDNADVLLIATGSEVELALKAAEKLGEENITAQVVSMPSVELFEQQSQSYRDSVIPPQVKSRVVVEAGLRSGWDRYLGEKGEFVGMSGFGGSAPADQLFDKFGITVESVVAAAKKSIG
jgi:transketolase